MIVYHWLKYVELPDTTPLFELCRIAETIKLIIDSYDIYAFVA